MIQMTVEVEDMFSDRLEQFGKRGPAMALRICRTIGMSFRAFTKKSYLRGQVIGKRTGTLYKGIKIVTDKRTRDAVIVRPWAKLANIYHKESGVDIVPKSGKMLKFDVGGRTVFTKSVHLRPRPWVPRALREFSWDAEIQKAADKVIEREVKKLEGSGGAG